MQFFGAQTVAPNGGIARGQGLIEQTCFRLLCHHATAAYGWLDVAVQTSRSKFARDFVPDLAFGNLIEADYAESRISIHAVWKRGRADNA